jgi:hypothetical protein
VTDRKVSSRLKFDQRLSVISVKNVLIERLASQTIQKFKKKTFSEKIINNVRLCRQGYAESKAVGIDYAEGRSYADGQIKLRRGTFALKIALDVDYADINYTLRRGLLAVSSLVEFM